MKQTSIEAHTDTENAKRRVSAKRAVRLWFQLFDDRPHTAKDVARGVARVVGYYTVLKRISDLSNEGVIKAVGTEQNGKKSYTLWQYDPTGTAKKRVSWKEAYKQAIDEWEEYWNEENGIYWRGKLQLGTMCERISARAEQIKNGEG